jgi:imidazolonepropionase-like amidohydrolase
MAQGANTHSASVIVAAASRTLRAFLRLLALLCFATAVAGAGEAPSSLAIVGATVIHPERDATAAVAPDTTIVIRRNRIQAVGPSRDTPIPLDARIIDAHDKWVVPGLIDAHVHFFQSGNLYARPDIADFTGWMPFAQETARNKARLPATFKVWLASGVTSVVDIGGPLWNFEMRESARWTEAAPRVAAAGPLVSMIARPQLDLGDPPIIQASTPEQARAIVQRELPYHPDYIKVWFIHEPGDDLARQEAIVKAAGEAAHAGGVRFAVHATELAVAKAALRAGADYLVHSVMDVLVDDEFIALARRADVLYCPTLFVLDGYALALSGRWQPTDVERRFADPQVLSAMSDLAHIPRDRMPTWVARLVDQGGSGASGVPHIALDNLQRVSNAGIRVVMGTDAGNIGTLHGPSVFREMELMARAGLTPLQILRAATTHGAAAMNLPDDIGAIAPGRLADLIIVDADPLERVGNLSAIHQVVRDGRIFDPDELIASLH